MRTRLLLLPSVAALTSLALAVPAQAQAESFPNKAGNYVSNHTEYFVAALVVAILILLLVVSITQRRGKEKAKQQKGSPQPAPSAGAPPAPPPERPGSPRLHPPAPLLSQPPRVWRPHRRRLPPHHRARRRNGGAPASSSGRRAWSSASNDRRHRNVAGKREPLSAPGGAASPCRLARSLNSHPSRRPPPALRFLKRHPSLRSQHGSRPAGDSSASVVPRSGAGARKRPRRSESWPPRGRRTSVSCCSRAGSRPRRHRCRSQFRRGRRLRRRHPRPLSSLLPRRFRRSHPCRPRPLPASRRRQAPTTPPSRKRGSAPRSRRSSTRRSGSGLRPTAGSRRPNASSARPKGARRAPRRARSRRAWRPCPPCSRRPSRLRPPRWTSPRRHLHPPIWRPPSSSCRRSMSRSTAPWRKRRSACARSRSAPRPPSAAPPKPSASRS